VDGEGVAAQPEAERYCAPIERRFGDSAACVPAYWIWELRAVCAAWAAAAGFAATFCFTARPEVYYM